MFLHRSNPKSISAQLNNPIAQLYDFASNAEIFSGGHSNCWTIYQATDKISKADVSIFHFEKKKSIKIPAKYVRQNRTSLTDMLRWDFAQLQKLKHPGLLKVLSPLHENSDSLAFAAERIRGTLASLLSTGSANTEALLSNHYHLYHPSQQQTSQPSPDHEDTSFEDIEIKCGLLQIAEAVGFLHCSAQMTLHGNISPENIFVTKYGAWRLGGFLFSQKCVDGKNKFPWLPWSPKLPLLVQPNLDYLAPEYVAKTDITTAADIFSFGCLVAAVFNRGRSPLQCENNLETYTKEIIEVGLHFEEMSKDFAPSLKDTVAKMLSPTIKDRPSTQLFTLAKYFHDSGASCLLQLESIEDNTDITQKAQFYCSQLRDTLYLIPQKVWFSRILPKLEKELQPSKQLSSAIVRPLLYMLEHSEGDGPKILAEIIKKIIEQKKCDKDLITADDNILHICLMENADVIGNRIHDKSLRDHMIKIFADGFDLPVQQVQVTAVCCLPKLKVYLTSEDIRSIFLTRLVKFFHAISCSKLKLNVLISVCALMDVFDSESIQSLLEFLCEVRTTDMEVAVSIAEVYKQAMADHQINLRFEFVAQSMIPSVSHFLANHTLDGSQLSVLAEVTRDLVDYAEYKQRLRICEEQCGDQRSKSICNSPCPQIRFQRLSMGSCDSTPNTYNGNGHRSSQSSSPSRLRRSSNYLSVDVDATPPRTPLKPAKSLTGAMFTTHSVPAFPPPSSYINRPAADHQAKAHSAFNSPFYSRRHSSDAARPQSAGSGGRRPSISQVGKQLSAEPSPVRKSSFTLLGQNLMNVFSWSSQSKPAPPGKASART